MILWRCCPARLRLLIRAHEEVVLEEVLEEVVVGVQCCLGEGRAVQMVLRDGLEVRRYWNDQHG